MNLQILYAETSANDGEFIIHFLQVEPDFPTLVGNGLVFYRLGDVANRSALEWILEYHKERKPKDPTILQKFNTYRFADDKDQLIDLLARICTASVDLTFPPKTVAL